MAFPRSDSRIEVTLLWGNTLIDSRCFEPGVPVRVGPSPDADFQLWDDAVPTTVELVSRDGVVWSPPGSRLTIGREGQAPALAGDGATLRLDEVAVVAFPTTFLVVRWVFADDRAASGPFDALDWYFAKALSTTFVLHAVLIAALWLAPANDDRLADEPFAAPSPLTKQVMVHPPRVKALAHAMHLSNLHRVRPGGTAKLRASVGSRRTQVLTAGLLGGASELVSLLGGSVHLDAALGKLAGGGPNDRPGTGSRSGPGTGGPLDIGSIGGSIGGPGDGSALSRKPDLYGKVAVAFTISGTGQVGSADVSESTLGDATAESCISAKIRRWRFPPPHGGGEVFVTYPWIFKVVEPS